MAFCFCLGGWKRNENNLDFVFPVPHHQILQVQLLLVKVLRIQVLFYALQNLRNIDPDVSVVTQSVNLKKIMTRLVVVNNSGKTENEVKF